MIDNRSSVDGAGVKGERLYECAWIDHTEAAHAEDPLDTRSGAHC
jgi:hypothetical protein